MDNMKLYNQARSVPTEAKKAITAGRLKGMTDVNPMYRIKRLTEIFGPCGIGWWYEITDKQIVYDELSNQKAAFVDILLYFVDPETGAVCHGIPGTGGAAFVAQERNGAYLSDECFKMALTDALSVACKALGIAADVYWDKDRTKYSTDVMPPEDPRQGQQQNRQNLQGQQNQQNLQNQQGQQSQQNQQGNGPALPQGMPPRKALIVRLKQLGIDAGVYAQEKGLNRRSTDADYLRCLEELDYAG